MSESTTGTGDVAVIVGGGPGVSASCARLFAREGMRVAIAARSPDKEVLLELEKDFGVTRMQCDAGEPSSVEALFRSVEDQHGTPRLVVHNIDGRMRDIFGKGIAESPPERVLEVLEGGAYSAFLVAHQAAKSMLEAPPNPNGHRGTVIFTNASAALKGFAKSGAFAMACHAKSGLAQSMARELMPQGIHVAHVPIDAAVGVPQADGTRRHRAAGEADEDNMAHPDRIAELYLELHRQHRSTWAFEVAVRPWNEKW